jgi:hypothetical protein
VSFDILRARHVIRLTFLRGPVVCICFLTIRIDVTRLLKTATFALFLVASLAAQAEEGDWYLSPSIGYADDDPDRKIDASFSGA